MIPLVEPSDTERAEWPDATRDYVAGLEARCDRLLEMHGKICTGCGHAWHLVELRATPGVLSCCPERKIVDAAQLWRQHGHMERQLAELLGSREELADALARHG